MKNIKKIQRVKRKKRIRAKIKGTFSKPRLVVFRSNAHIYAQIIDDNKKLTLVATSDLNLKKVLSKKKSTPKEIAFKVGEKIAQLASEKNIKTVVFDRNGYKFHGRTRSLAEGARSAGLVL